MLQGKQGRIVLHQDQGIREGIPVAHSAEDGNGGQDRLAQGPYDLPEHRHEAGAVDEGAFLQLRRDGLDIGLHQNDVIRSHNGGDDIGCEMARQAQHGHVHVPGDDAGIEIHGDDDEPVPQLPVPHLLLGDKIADEGGGQHHEDRAQNGSGNRDGEGIENVVDLQHIHIVSQIDAHGDQGDLAGGHQGAVGNGVDEDIVEGEDAGQGEDGENAVVQEMKDLVAGGIFVVRPASAYFSHCVFPPYTTLLPRIILDALLAMNSSTTEIMDLVMPTTVDSGMEPLPMPRL